MSGRETGFTDAEVAHFAGLAFQTHPDLQAGAHAELQVAFTRARDIAGQRNWNAKMVKRAVTKMDGIAAGTGLLIAAGGAGPVVGGLTLAAAAAVEGICRYGYNAATTPTNTRVATLRGLMEEAGVAIPEPVKVMHPNTIETPTPNLGLLPATE